MSLVERVEQLCEDPSDDRSLRSALLDEIRREVPFDWYVWLMTDPATEVGSAPMAEIPTVKGLPRLIRAKYTTEVNRWTRLDTSVATLQAATTGELRRHDPWRQVLGGFGMIDVASTVFRDGFGCWGWLDLWRGSDAGPFDAEALRSLARIVHPITAGLRRTVARSFVEAPTEPIESDGPLVLVLSPGLEVKAQTPDTEAYLSSLIPPVGDRRAIPAAAYNVAAQVLAGESGTDTHPPTARVHLGGGTWLALRAARIDSSAPIDERDIAVSIELASPAQRRDLFTRSHALTPREVDVVDQLALGADTRAMAKALFVSEHTIQDHLKSIFAKTGTRSRRTLLSRLSGH